MEKKAYIIPTMSVVTMKPAIMLAASPGGSDQTDPTLIGAEDPFFADPLIRQILGF